MKRFFASITALLMLLSLAACSSTQTAAEHGITKTALVLVGDVINKSGYSKSRLYAEDFSTEFRAAKKS